MKRTALSAALALGLMTTAAWATPDLTGRPTEAEVKRELRAFAEGFTKSTHEALGWGTRLAEVLPRYTTAGIAPEIFDAFGEDARTAVAVDITASPYFAGRHSWRDDLDHEELRGPWEVQVPLRVVFADGTEESRLALFQIIETQPSEVRPEPWAVSGLKIRNFDKPGVPERDAAGEAQGAD